MDKLEEKRIAIVVFENLSVQHVFKLFNFVVCTV